MRFPSRAAETESTKQQIKLILLDLQTRPLIARREINDLVKNKGIKDAKGGGGRQRRTVTRRRLGHVRTRLALHL